MLQLIDADKDKKPVGKKPKSVLEEVERAFFTTLILRRKPLGVRLLGKPVLGFMD